MNKIIINILEKLNEITLKNILATVTYRRQRQHARLRDDDKHGENAARIAFFNLTHSASFHPFQS